MHKGEIDREKIASLPSKKERMDLMAAEHGALKDQIKAKLVALADLDPDYAILSDGLVIIPAICISCNEKMKDALESDPELTIEENSLKFAIC